MGEPAEVWAQRIKQLEPYRVTADVMAMAADDAIFMHCLPSFHDTNTTIGREIADKFGITEMEVSDDVFLGRSSRRSSTRPKTACTRSRLSCTPP